MNRGYFSSWWNTPWPKKAWQCGPGRIMITKHWLCVCVCGGGGGGGGMCLCMCMWCLHLCVVLPAWLCLSLYTCAYHFRSECRNSTCHWHVWKTISMILANQVYVVLVLGESGLGKSTLINSLFLTDLYSAEYPGPSNRIKKTVSVSHAAVDWLICWFNVIWTSICFLTPVTEPYSGSQERIFQWLMERNFCLCSICGDCAGGKDGGVRGGKRRVVHGHRSTEGYSCQLFSFPITQNLSSCSMRWIFLEISNFH